MTTAIIVNDSDGEKPKFPDGGWGWVIVFSCLTLCLIQDGISFSFGLLFDTFVQEFSASNTAVSWIGSLFVSVPLLAGPVMSVLVDKFGCRLMTIVGGAISATGFVLSTFGQSITVMYFTFGIISGLGLGLTFVTCIVPIAFWFDKKRNLAVGIGSCGIGIGTFVFSPFTTFLLEYLGWRGTVLILAGTLLNICVCGALMRDPDWMILQNRKENVEMKEITTSIEDLERHQSLVNLPTFDKTEPIKVSTPEAGQPLLDRKKEISRILKTSRTSLAQRGSLLHLNIAMSCPNIAQSINSEENQGFLSKFKEIIDYTMFFDFHFLLVSLSTILLFAWFMTPYFYLPNHMIMFGYTKNHASYVTAVIGVMNTLGMILLGWAGDQSWVNIPLTYAICLIVCGISCSLLVFATSNYFVLIAMSAIYGLSLASTFVFTPIILMDLISLDKFTASYGLILLCQGIGHLAGPPIGGYLRDLTGLWNITFHLSAFWIIISGILILIIPYTKNRQFLSTE